MKKSRALSLIAILLTSFVSTSCNTNNSATSGNDNSSDNKDSNTPIINSSGSNNNNNNNSSNSNPSIDNVIDEFLDLEDGGTYNPLAFVTAYDKEDGDISNRIEVTIEDNINGGEVDKIYMNSPGEYTITFFVQDSDGNMDLKSCVVTIGDPYATGPDTPTCPGTGYRYDINNLTYNLAWSEEFNYEGGVDPYVWTHETGTGNWGWGNGEKQYYTNRKENAEVKDGKLRITALKESYGGSKYTSARIITRGKKVFKYGKFEASIKLPQGRGTWPAFWLLPTTGVWPNDGEIDIMEAVGYRPNLAFGTAHSKDRNGTKDNGGRGMYITVDTMYTEYHTYGVEWLPDGLRFYVDDEIYYEYFPRKQVECPTRDMWPFDKNDFFIILNVAIGGEWGGAQGIDDNIFNQYDVSMYVDYVRYYEAEEIKAFK